MRKNNLRFAKEWVMKAQSDLETAEILYREKGPTDSLCFHCQQAAEKMLKAFLVFNKGKYSKIHDLINLLNICKKIDESFKNLENEASFLNRFYVETRYPPEIINYTREECEEALGLAQKLTQFILNKISQ